MTEVYAVPSWKKWIPVYGLLREERCDLEGEPLLHMDWNDRRLSYRMNCYYQVACLVGTGASVIKGLELILEKLM